MGVLSPFPAQFGDLFGTGKLLATFNDDFAFDLSAKSTVTGSLSVFFGSVSFSSVLIDGNSLALSATPTGYGLSLANLGVGTHALTVAGSYPTGANAYSGSLYATDCHRSRAGAPDLLDGFGWSGHDGPGGCASSSAPGLSRFTKKQTGFKRSPFFIWPRFRVRTSRTCR